MSKAAEPPRRDIAGLGRLWRFVRPYRARLAAAMLALVIAAGAVLALGQGLRHVIDTGLHSATAALLDRAREIGWTLSVLSQPSQGTRILVSEHPPGGRE